jgi:hypothetical protein
MNELEERFIDQWCALFGKSIRGHLGSDNVDPIGCLQERLWDMADIATAKVHRAFVHEVLSRIAEIAPEASQRIKTRILARKHVAATPFFGDEEKGEYMGDFYFKARFIDGWCEVFSQLLEAQLNDSESGNISKLRSRYQNLAEIASPDVTQEFFREVISRTGEVVPEAAERLLRSLLGRGILQERPALKGEG